jgi:hypothetical protein
LIIFLSCFHKTSCMCALNIASFHNIFSL